MSHNEEQQQQQQQQLLTIFSGVEQALITQTHIHSANPVKDLTFETSTHHVRVGVSTHLGGSRTIAKNRQGNPSEDGNQDTADAFIIDADKSAYIIADGHGLLGQPISIAVTEFVKTQLMIRKDELTTDLGARQVFTEICVQSEDLVKQISIQKSSTSIGGTTLTGIVIVANLLYTFQIGDSDAYIVTPEPILSESEHLDYCFDTIDAELTKPTNETKTAILKISKCPSFEDRKEYDRIKASNGLVVFDGSDRDIYETGELGTGMSYKTVKREWAITMSTRSGGTRLSMPRTVGDFNVKECGSSFMPVITCVNLSKIPGLICVFYATDGVHDNWIEDHLQKFLMDKSCLDAVTAEPYNRGAQRVCESFKIRNATFGNKNFKEHQDNATNCAVYLLPK